MKIYKQPLIITTILLSLFVLHGCSTLNKNECINANWYQIGFEDGNKGHSMEQISRHRTSCAEHGISVDLNQYRLGREEGLTLYCVPHKGLERGKRGKSYTGVCSQHNETAYIRAFDYGYYLYDLRTHIKKREHHLSGIQHEYEHVTNDINDIEAQIISDKTSPEKRKNLLNKAKHLTHKQSRIHVSIANLREDIRSLKDDYREANSRRTIKKYLP